MKNCIFEHSFVSTKIRNNFDYKYTISFFGKCSTVWSRCWKRLLKQTEKVVWWHLCGIAQVVIRIWWALDQFLPSKHWWKHPATRCQTLTYLTYDKLLLAFCISVTWKYCIFAVDSLRCFFVIRILHRSLGIIYFAVLETNWSQVVTTL